MNNKKKKMLIIWGAILAVCLVGICIWHVIRVTTTVTCTKYEGEMNLSYKEEDSILKALSLSYFIYGCENSENLTGTVGELLTNNHMGIMIENFGITREDETDPKTAAFDTTEFVKRYIDDFRLLESLKDSASSFYGAAFCDDRNHCVWISYSGSESLADCFACAELVINPGMSTQEKLAFQLYETVMTSDEVKNQSYSVVLTGHSMGGALASMISRMSGCRAITINGADGVALDKINNIMGDTPNEYRISNYMTNPPKGSFSFKNLIQSLMFLGSYKSVDYYTFEQNRVTTDAHCAFSFLQFDEDYLTPIIPGVTN